MINTKKADKLCSFFAAPTDYLARRRSNTAPTKRANINTTDIEQSGVSLEQLDGLVVPVYRYQTQITIHGIWQDTDGYCLGYKHLVKNKNGSIGIRYGAIDGAKKARLRDLCQYSKFRSSHNSTGTMFYMSFQSKHRTRALKVFEYIKRHKGLFVGDVTAFYDRMYSGRYYIVIDLAAIPESNMSAFENNILKVNDIKITMIDTRRAAEQERRRIERERQDKERADNKAIAKQQAVETLIKAGYKPITPNGKDYKGIEPTYTALPDNNYGPAFRLVEVKRKAFGPCFKSVCAKTIEPLETYQFDWTKKSRRLDRTIEQVYIK